MSIERKFQRLYALEAEADSIRNELMGGFLIGDHVQWTGQAEDGEPIRLGGHGIITALAEGQCEPCLVIDAGHGYEVVIEVMEASAFTGLLPEEMR